jgi:mRNA degradation ribonuclease J1/J2
MFESDMYGIDLVLPQFDYVRKTTSICGHRSTHGH